MRISIITRFARKAYFEMKDQPVSKSLFFKESNTLLLEAIFAGVETTR